MRELPGPILDSIVRRRLRESRGGIQKLQSAGYDTARAEARLNHKAAVKAFKQRHRPFVAWDGEGWSDNDGEHHYFYMANSVGYYVEWPKLTTRECLLLMLKSGHEFRDAIHVIYGGGYDVTQILRDWPASVRQRLIDNGVTVHEGFRVEYVPHKWLTLAGVYNDETVRLTIYDVMTFFQSSFIEALKSRHIDVPDEITVGKAGRDTFGPQDIEQIKVYTGLELTYLVRLCDALRSEFEAAGIPGIKYHGPGAVANAVMRKYGVKSRMGDEPTPEIENACALAYFGGRFEARKIGHHVGDVYQADIVSAYPDAIRKLPSLRDAIWQYRREFTGRRGIWRCRLGSGDTYGSNPLPWRHRSGAVAFPAAVDEVWLWDNEAVYADDVMDGYELIVTDDVLPFGYIDELFQVRRQMKADKNGGERAIKLALNSHYGKMAQRIGARDGKRPSFHQLAWAGMVTSAARTKLWGAMQLAPDSIISVETDSICTTVPLALDYGEELGQWELSEYNSITYLQSGVYWTNGGIAGKAKTRGLEAGKLDYDDVMRYMASDLSSPIETTVRRFVALGNPQVAHYGNWLDMPRELGVSGGKRIHVAASCDECLAGKSLADSMHTTMTVPIFGAGPSRKHFLPWVDGVAAVNVDADDERYSDGYH